MRRLGDMKSFGKVAKQGVIWSFLREGVTEIVLFPSSMIAARLLTPAEFGLAASGLFFVQFAARLGDLGFNAALVRAKVVTEEHMASVFTVNLGLGVLSFAVLALLAPLVRAFYGIAEIGDILPIASFSFVIVPLGSIPGAMMTRDGRFREAAMVDWYASLTFAVFSVIFALFGLSFWSLIYARLLSSVAQAVSRHYFHPWRPSFRVSKAAIRDVLSFGLGSQAKRQLDYAANNLDNLAVGKLMGMTALGFYDKAFSTMNRFLVRLNTGGPAMMFRVFSLIHEDSDRFSRAYSRVLMASTLFAFPLFAGLAVAAPQVMTVLFGRQWLPAAVPFQILAVAGMLKLVNSYASAAVQGAGYAWSEVTRQLLYLVLIVGGIYLMRSWGPAGSAAAVLMATAVMFVLMHILLIRIAALTWSQVLRPQIPAILCAVGVALVAAGVEYAFVATIGRPPGAVLLMVQGVLSVAFSLAFVLYAPLPIMRDTVGEIVADVTPKFLQGHRAFKWFQRRLVEGHATQG